MALISTAPTARLHRLRVSSERYDCDGLHARVVRAVGLEPTRRCHRGILSPLRLPVPPRPLLQPDQLLIVLFRPDGMRLLCAEKGNPSLNGRAAKAKPQSGQERLL